MAVEVVLRYPPVWRHHVYRCMSFLIGAEGHGECASLGSARSLTKAPLTEVRSGPETFQEKLVRLYGSTRMEKGQTEQTQDREGNISGGMSEKAVRSRSRSRDRGRERPQSAASLGPRNESIVIRRELSTTSSSTTTPSSSSSSSSSLSTTSSSHSNLSKPHRNENTHYHSFSNIPCRFFQGPYGCEKGIHCNFLHICNGCDTIERNGATFCRCRR